MIKPAFAAISGALPFSRTAKEPRVEMTPGRIRIELLSGLTVALALVPEAVAFAFVAGVNPLVGLYAAFIICMITSVFGGRPGMISGATGALAVVMVSLVATHGVEYLFAAVVVMGIIQLLAGALKLGKFIRLVPHPVMLGFVNGLAIVIFLAQFEQFKVTDAEGMKHWISGFPLLMMLGLVALTMLVIYVVPKVTKSFPAPLAAILVVAGLVIGLDIPVPRVGDLASISGGLPDFAIPSVPMTLETLKIILPYSLIFAAIGLIESLLTLNLVGEKTGTRGGASQECMAQGAANVVTGFFGGMGGCAMIGQSMINVESGARTRLSGIAAAVLLLSFILFASSLIEQIPLAALIGVMFMVVIGTFAWKSFTIIARVPRTDAAVIVMVTIITVMTDLAIAVVAGVIISALAYAWSNATRIRANIDETEDGVRIYQIEGPLFFGSVAGFLEIFHPVTDPARVIVDFKNSRVADQSALQAIETLAARYQAHGTTLELRHLSRDCHTLLSRAGQLMIDSDDDPDYGIAAHYGVRIGRFGEAH